MGDFELSPELYQTMKEMLGQMRGQNSIPSYGPHGGFGYPGSPIERPQVIPPNGELRHQPGTTQDYQMYPIPSWRQEQQQNPMVPVANRDPYRTQNQRQLSSPRDQHEAEYIQAKRGQIPDHQLMEDINQFRQIQRADRQSAVREPFGYDTQPAQPQPHPLILSILDFLKQAGAKETNLYSDRQTPNQVYRGHEYAQDRMNGPYILQRPKAESDRFWSDFAEKRRQQGQR